MNKEKFTQIVKEGLDRGKCFLIVKVRGLHDVKPRIVIIQSEDIIRYANSYMKGCDDEMIFKNTGDKMIDALMTNNLNDLSWFVY